MQRLTAYIAAHGHARVPQKYVDPDGFGLGKWVHNQRTAYRARTQAMKATALSDERVARLEQVPGWTWNARSTAPSPPTTPVAAPATGRKAPAVSPTPPPVVSPPPPPAEPGVPTISAAEYEERVRPWTYRRALQRWQAEHPSTATGQGSLTGADISTDRRFQGLLREEEVRTSMAGMVAYGAVIARDGTGDLLDWATILTAPRIPIEWQFALNLPMRGEPRVPVAVLDTYRALSGAETTAAR